jgi:hypothetical protein
VLKDCFSYIHNVDKKEEREAARKEKENTVREERRRQKQAEIIYLLTNHAFPPMTYTGCFKKVGRGEEESDEARGNTGTD